MGCLTVERLSGDLFIWDERGNTCYNKKNELSGGVAMRKTTLKNGMKLIYEKRDANIASFCIALDAGALREQGGFLSGTAHALEHMLYKGTKTRSEEEINRISDEIFGFSNAMTNYPYVIYYGTTLSGNIEKGLELYSDILLNPALEEDGFREEMSIISEELREWSEDLSQLCEDKLFRNCFRSRRIGERIIGSQDTIAALSMDELRRFYRKHYMPQNCVLAVVTPDSFEDTRELAEKYFGGWEKGLELCLSTCCEENEEGVFVEQAGNMEGAKIEYCFPIHGLSLEEEKALSVFSYHFGEGVTSILYEEIRTKRGLAYDVSCRLRKENGIKLLTVNVSTARENVDRVTGIIDGIIGGIISGEAYNPDPLQLRRAEDMLKIRRELLLEKSVQLAKELSTFELMYGSCGKVYSEFDGIGDLEPGFVKRAAARVLKNRSVQILI
ncbi:MAG: peptidase [Firmicutes bacterium]|nr:peptidase [Bacillota bacterium]